ncbi:TetR/AcrR family transcriptional regulator [Neobacillus sp. 114]|uniref:TetR/AcrR family transcriptional regulator n=1 Tax=Neobacillus sp. 114 TaxID=3048535 RepID=UPI0024C3A174|nr:TetR/AcrR family transcriptional regulator [Neobacillus sp. 114]
MYDRKQHVIEKAFQLFIEKGFQNTSIQDILDYSGISKGTFYNYFSSKNELLIAVFTSIFKKMDRERTKLMIDQDPADIEIFIKQMEFQMKSNQQNRVFTLFQEVFFSNDKELKEFLERGKFMMLRWVYKRFIDLFGVEKQPYLMDCAIMFIGILQQNFHFEHNAHGSNTRVNQIVRYSVERIVKIVQEVAESGAQLNDPEILDKWLPDCQKKDQEVKDQLIQIVSSIRKSIHQEIPSEIDQEKYIELLDFIQDEILQTKAPRKYLIESTVVTLKSFKPAISKKGLQQLEQWLSNYFHQFDEMAYSRKT